MTARLLLPHDAPRDEWHAARRQGVTASEIAAILGISPWDSAFNIYYRKQGLIDGPPETDEMSLGTYLEPWIADRWASDHPDLRASMGGLYASAERPWQMATPDRLIDAIVCDCTPHCTDLWEPPSVLEIKTSGTYDGWGAAGTDQIPPYYRAQVLWQMDVLGLPDAHVTCLFLGTRQRRDYVVAYDEADVKLMREAAEDFRDRLAAGTPPPVDDHKATTTALKALYGLDEDTEVEVPRPLAERYRLACARVAEWKATKRGIENELRSAMGSAKYALDPDGRKVVTRSVYDVAPRLMPGCTVDKLTSPRTKKEPE